MKQNFDAKIRNEINEQTIFAFFENLYIDLNVTIEKRKNFDALTNRETIFVQNINFFDVANVAIDDENDMFFERSRTIFDVKIEKNKNFDVKNEKIIDRNDEKNFDSKTNETNKIKNEITCSTNC